jgi:16S rRNA (uracil1498-N3)-methyltransferase
VTLHRFFIDAAVSGSPEAGVELALSEHDRHHLVRVLRLGAGDRIIVVDTEGREAECTLVEVSPDRVTADLDAAVIRPRRPRVVIAPAISRRERMELTVQKVTELGVAEIWPLLTARCVVRLDDGRAGRKAERWRRIAEEAAKQSQRETVPLVREPMTIAELAADAGCCDVVLVPWEEASAGGLGMGQALDRAGATAETSVLVAIGPEGGLEEGEIAALEAAGGVVVTLGDTVLRTETAAIVAAALAMYELGALGGRGR